MAKHESVDSRLGGFSTDFRQWSSAGQEAFFRQLGPSHGDEGKDPARKLTCQPDLTLAQILCAVGVYPSMEGLKETLHKIRLAMHKGKRFAPSQEERFFLKLEKWAQLSNPED